MLVIINTFNGFDLYTLSQSNYQSRNDVTDRWGKGEFTNLLFQRKSCKNYASWFHAIYICLATFNALICFLLRNFRRFEVRISVNLYWKYCTWLVKLLFYIFDFIMFHLTNIFLIMFICLNSFVFRFNNFTDISKSLNQMCWNRDLSSSFTSSLILVLIHDSLLCFWY